MAQYINKSDLVAEIERRKDVEVDYDESSLNFASYADQIHYSTLDSIEDFINTLEVKETELPNPRFPHLDGIVEKVFGMGNLESWEYEEAKQLVLLAKEELLKDFIEKSCGWLKKNAGKYTWYDESDGESGMVYGFIDAFKNHMKEK